MIIKKRKKRIWVHRPYTRRIKQKQKRGYKKVLLPHPQPNQSMKSTKCEYPPSIYTLSQTKKLLRKIFFSRWSNNSSQSKYLLFLSFQIVQKIQGAALQALIRLLSAKEPCHLGRVSLTNSDITHRIPKMENTSCHKSLALFQWWSPCTSKV